METVAQYLHMNHRRYKHNRGAMWLMKPRILLVKSKTDSTKEKAKIWASYIKDEDIALKKYFESSGVQYVSSKGSEQLLYILYYSIRFLMMSRNNNDVFVVYGCNRMSWLLCLLKPIIAPRILLIILEFAVITSLPFFKRVIYSFAYKKASLICVCSENEIALYANFLRIKKNQIIHLAAPIENDYFLESTKKHFTEEEYILSAGKGYRDYKTVLKAAQLIKTKIPIYIIADNNSLFNIGKIPYNVKILGEVDRDTYFRFLINSKFVVVPLQMVERSAGNQVIYQAIASGKHVVASNISCTAELQRNHPKFVYLFECYNAVELAKIIDRTIEFISVNGTVNTAEKIYGRELWGVEAFYQNLSKAVEKILPV